MPIKVDKLDLSTLEDVLDDLARLRMTVFREWPYLYDGDIGYERRYLSNLQKSPLAIVVGAYVGDWLVGASTGTPLADHAGDFAAAFSGHDLDVADVFYCAESILLPRFRGHGVGKLFFDMREAHARALGFKKVAFCAVVRSATHPLFPGGYRPLDGFWRARGYAPLDGALAHFSWKDLDESDETPKALQFWIRDL